MDSQSPHHLILAGKSSAEVELAKTLKSNNNLKLTGDDAVCTYIYSEMGKPFHEESFHIESFMNSLSTNHFGRLLMWSPRLPSTHDIVSQYVHKKHFNFSLYHYLHSAKSFLLLLYFSF